MTPLTPKAQRTRQRILDAAITQFVEKGYEATTMRDIADAAECSTGLAYRYFSRKEDLVVGLWEQLAKQAADEVDHLPEDSMTERFYQLNRLKIAQITPYRNALGALFGAAMNPASGVAVMGSESAHVRDITLDALERLVADASDAVRDASVRQMALLLYVVHLLIVLVWLYDTTPTQRITNNVLALARDLMSTLRPMLRLPMVSRIVSRLADIAEGLFLPETLRELES